MICHQIVASNVKWKMFSNFVAFSEYLNFKSTSSSEIIFGGFQQFGTSVARTTTVLHCSGITYTLRKKKISITFNRHAVQILRGIARYTRLSQGQTYSRVQKSTYNFVFRPKMAIFRRAGMRKGGLPLPLAFQYLILMI